MIEGRFVDLYDNVSFLQGLSCIKRLGKRKGLWVHEDNPPTIAMADSLRMTCWVLPDLLKTEGVESLP